jgi:hypothetical protein
MLLRQRYSALLGGHTMTKITSLHAIAGALLACGLSAAPAHALNGRTWVSGHGTDSGACTLALTCKTFAFALTQTAAPGEIDVLDPGGKSDDRVFILQRAPRAKCDAANAAFPTPTRHR